MGDPDPDLDPELDNYHQFLVIGGGISGLSAASHLAKNGFKDFRLLEARNRLGGRIATMQLGKTFLSKIRIKYELGQGSHDYFFVCKVALKLSLELIGSMASSVTLSMSWQSQTTWWTSQRLV